MITLSQARRAVRARLKTLVVCTTGSVTLTATKTGYTRAVGSFIDDGFRIGYEVTSAGFTKNLTSVITELTDTELTLLDARSAQVAGAGRTLTAGLPRVRIWGNNLQPDAIPDAAPYIYETFLPGTGVQRGLTQGGTEERLPVYAIQWWGLPDTSDDALTEPADAICALFAPAVTQTLPSGLRVRGDLLPTYTLVEQDQERKRPVCAITIYLRLYNS